MESVTYTDPKVIDFLNEKVIPLKIQFDAEPYATDFQIKWTPTLIILNSEGKERRRTVGFLEVNELIPSVLLGVAKAYFETDQFDKAKENLARIIVDYSSSSAASEAVYLNGVCGYKSTHNLGLLKEAYETLKEKFPESEWTKKAYPYRLL